MRTARSIAIALGLYAACAQAQEQPVKPLIAEGYLGYGSFSNPVPRTALSDWRAMLPGSALLARDMAGLSAMDHYGGGYPGAGYYGPWGYRDGMDSYASGGGYAGLGLDLGRRAEPGARFEHRLRIGASVIGSEDISSRWSRSLSGRYDTLVSQQTGQMTYIDTTWSEAYSAYAYRSRAALDVSYIVRRASASRWSWYAGAGLLIGLTHGGRAETMHAITRWRDARGSYSSGYERTVLEEESFTLKSTFFGAAHATFGIDLRLGRTSPFWSQLHLFAELRPLLQLNAYPGLPARMDGGLQSFFGLRVDLR